ncbi:hypothetical protein [Leptospira kmetyi]|uniref:Uncharacterized protein n=1 Tax=Leptospira kmetyi TaxID=408139 RepID=A0A2M9XP74_9LEPT|nr:hypothetical protein [Leptospira kmetyi]AYV56022.1 hypothetical protein EFP84_11205 [Leptospira kmetyi]EQA53165.1 hypothetical protein LEP1GSC052_3630 [Leptospira kmetyi serovar Malaysia str. Bejo-Iso9]PJZ31426.1 hypothetical protein CH378_02765 [Leptospira kmetyi]PJZ41120.1 hypothetical protein CH370_12810 [Leptospira kmetyi]TGK16161.1 hypothetical protein EHO62_10430 [Leptospira kmetyi]
MKVVSSVQLGLPEKGVKDTRKIPKEEGMVRVEPYENKQANVSDRKAFAVEAGQNGDFYKVKGTFIDKVG